MNLPRFVLYHGVDTPPARLIELRAGPLTMSLDPETAFLRYIRYGDREILRGIYAAVRDHNWGTPQPKLRDLRVVQTPSSFEVGFQADCVRGAVDFSWTGRITGAGDGAVVYSFEGEARSAFRRNRIGFCVLHPIRECAGRPCTLETVSGAIEKGVFPDLISPHQPFFDLRAITHAVEPGLEAEVRMEGDTFETEDQRNWTDASFKTYCTPLSLPFPVQVNRGDRIRQSVTVRLKGTGRPAAAVARSPEVILEAGEKELPLPRIGFQLAAGAPAPGETETARLKALRPAHFRVDLKMSGGDWQALLRRAVAEECRLTGAPLEAAVHLGGDAEAQLRALAAEMGRFPIDVARWLIFHDNEKSTAGRWVELARRYLNGTVGGGTIFNFTELNRGRPAQPGGVVCYSINPQVHAFDNLSLVESCEGVRHTIRTARSFCGNAWLAVTPVTLKIRENPNATGEAPPVPAGELPPRVDPRQMSLFGAGWTLACLQALAESGAGSATFYETTGWLGLMETANGSPLPEKFHSIPGGVFPLYHVFADLAGFAGGTALPVAVSDPMKAAGMALRDGKSARVLAANLTPEVQYLRIAGAGLGDRARVWLLDEHRAAGAMADPERFRAEPDRVIQTSGALELALLPFAYARIDAA
jgi:hypothetical protein